MATDRMGALRSDEGASAVMSVAAALELPKERRGNPNSRHVGTNEPMCTPEEMPEVGDRMRKLGLEEKFGEVIPSKNFCIEYYCEAWM